MDQEDLGDGMSGGWGTGLLWPVARYAAIAAVLMAAAHWLLNAGNGAPAPVPPAGEVAVKSEPKPVTDAIDDSTGERTLHADPSGHYFIDAAVNGETLRLLIDTGASTLVLSRDDAQRLGLSPQTLNYSDRYQTANGVAFGAPVSLREFRVGSFTLHDIPATVMAQPMPISLLGMSVLSRFAGHEVEGTKMVLRW